MDSTDWYQARDHSGSSSLSGTVMSSGSASVSREGPVLSWVLLSLHGWDSPSWHLLVYPPGICWLVHTKAQPPPLPSLGTDHKAASQAGQAVPHCSRPAWLSHTDPPLLPCSGVWRPPGPLETWSVSCPGHQDSDFLALSSFPALHRFLKESFSVILSPLVSKLLSPILMVGGTLRLSPPWETQAGEGRVWERNGSPWGCAPWLSSVRSPRLLFSTSSKSQSAQATPTPAKPGASWEASVCHPRNPITTQRATAGQKAGQGLPGARWAVKTNHSVRDVCDCHLHKW